VSDRIGRKNTMVLAFFLEAVADCEGLTPLHNFGEAAYNSSGSHWRPIMLIRFLRASLPAVLAGTVGLQLAHADIYTWVDASGAVNVSNLAPPESVHVTSVIHASAAASAARDAAVRDAARQAEVQALSDRVRQLEDEVQFASRGVPPQVEYRAIPAPPVIQYVINQAPPPVQYPVNAAPSTYTGCDSMWIECGFWQNPVIYPTSVIFLRAPNFRRPQPFRDGHQFVVHQPTRAPGAFRRG
jgi:Domain of unknown function (DUF4124)